MKPKFLSIFMVCTAFLAFIYVAVRGCQIGITHDEAFTFYNLNINYFRALLTTANTHWLNTILMKIPNSMGFNEIWVLRLPSILVFILYAYFVIKIALFLKTPLGIYSLIAFFFINAFVLEYFSLARGYALSISFFIGSIYFVVKIISSDSKKLSFKDFLLAVLFGSLSVFANYASFFQYVGLCVLLVYFVKRKYGTIRFIFFNKWRSIILLFILTCFVTITNLLLIKYISNDLNFGGSYSFFSDTLQSIIDNIINFSSHNKRIDYNQPYLNWSSGILFTLLLITFIFSAYRKNRFILFFSSLFLINFLISNLLFYLLGTPFPFGRTALILFPSIAFSFVFFFDQLGTPLILNWFSGIIIIVIFSFFFLSNAAFDRSNEWPAQADAFQIFEGMANLNRIKDTEKTAILSDFQIHGVWRNYYYQIDPIKYGFKYKLVLNEEFLSYEKLQKTLKGYEYLIISDRFYGSYMEQMKELKLVSYYPKSKTRIFKISMN